MKTKFRPITDLTSTNAILLYLSLFKLFLLLVFAPNYGLFRDEYYYIEISKHLAWGYVDMQPLSAVFLAVSRALFGDSITGIRVFAYLAGTAVVYLSGLVAREMHGSKSAQVFTAFLVIFSGVILGNSSYFSMNSFDILLSTLMFYYLLRLINSENPKYWITIGILIGIGLENKLTFIFLSFGLVAGLLLTRYRTHLKLREIWLAAGISSLLFLPNIIWQISHDFPTLEFIHNATVYKNRSMGFGEFTLNALKELNPGYTLFMVTGLYFLFFMREGRNYRILAWIFLAVFLVFVLNNGKPYYMGVLYPAFLAAGVTGADSMIRKYLDRYSLLTRAIVAILTIPSAFIVTPFAIPVLPADSFIKYSDILGIRPTNSERSTLGLLPQFYADRFGWEDMVRKVTDVYNTLSPAEKKDVLIFGQNYGEAGAVNFYRKKYNLPPAISSHNNYWLWGYPENASGNLFIVIGSNYKDNSEFFEQVDPVAKHFSRFGMPYENVEIFICRNPKMPVSEIWSKIKKFI